MTPEDGPNHAAPIGGESAARASWIRPMTPGDLDAVMQIERASFRSPWSREVLLEELKLPQARIEVLEIEGRIVCVANYWIVADELHLLNIATHPARRRSGHAATMMQHLVETARRAALNQIVLEVRRSNDPAQGLYRRFGFRSVGVRPQYYADNLEDALVMTREF